MGLSKIHLTNHLNLIKLSDLFRLSRSSHRELADGESEENSARDSSGERRKGRRSLRNASASDDSVSPEKHKHHRSSRGKLKPGDSSEDGQRTQDSCEEMSGFVETTSDRQDSPVGDVSLSAVEDTDHRSDVCETEERPHSSVEEEESVESANSLISQMRTPVDPFDQLKAEGTKTLTTDSTTIVSDEKPVSDKRVVTCDSTEESRLEQKKEESTVTVKLLPSSDFFEEKSEVCDSSVDVQKETHKANLPEETPIEVQWKPMRESRDSSIKKIPIEGDASEEKPVSEDSAKGRHKVRNTSKKVSESQDSSEETHTVKDTSRKERSSRDKSEERRVGGSTRKDGRSRDKSEERGTVHEPSRKDAKSRDLSAESLALQTLQTSEEKPNDPTLEKTQVEDKTSSVEHKHKSRRLNRTAAGDRHRHVSPHKADVEVEATTSTNAEEVSPKKSKVKNDISGEPKEEISIPTKRGADQFISPEKSKSERDPSPRKSKEEKTGTTDSKPRREPSQRTRIVWDEKPAVESRRQKEPVAPRDKSHDVSTKRSPPKHEEVKEVTAHVRVPSVKVSSVEVAEPLPPKRRELKRLFSSKTKTSAECEENGESGDKGQQACYKEDAGVARKRRWGGGVTSAKPVLSISSDSLKVNIFQSEIVYVIGFILLAYLM